MPVRKLKPVTPSQRFRIVNGFDAITTDKPERSLLTTKKRTGGRNNHGKMTSKYRGGGHKRRYRINDFAYITDLKKIEFITSDGLLLKSLFKRPSSKEKSIIMVFHGNAGHIGHRVEKFRPFLEEGHGLFLVEYRGYGENSGKPSLILSESK